MGELVHHLQPCLPPLSCHAPWKVTEFVRKSAVRDNVRLSIWVIVSIPHCTCKLFSALSTCVGVVSKLINVEMKSRCQQAPVSGPIRREQDSRGLVRPSFVMRVSGQMFLISDHEYQEPRASPSGWRKNRHMNIMNIGCWFSLIVLSLHCLTSPSSYITFAVLISLSAQLSFPFTLLYQL